MDLCVATFPKNAFEEIRVQVKQFKGYDLVDIRVFADSTLHGMKVPTGKGVSVPVAHFEELKQAILKMEEVLHEHQLFKNNDPLLDG